jgi:hypothetical protein
VVIVGETDGGGNVFSTLEDVHTIFEVDVLVENMFRVRRTARRECGGCSRHLVDSSLLDEALIKILGGSVID